MHDKSLDEKMMNVEMHDKSLDEKMMTVVELITDLG
jgi:hypothetical protein